MKRRSSVTAYCLKCGAEYHPYPSHYRTGRTRFCSRECSDALRYGTPEERFWRGVQKTRGCWNFRPNREHGYRQMLVKGRAVIAHRFSWELHFGPIPDGLIVCHHCDNRACVRPDHLFLGTHATNATDKIRKGRAGWPAPHNPSRGEDRYNARLTEKDVKKIRRHYENGTASQADMARKYGLSRETIGKIVHRKKWSHVA